MKNITALLSGTLLAGTATAQENQPPILAPADPPFEVADDETFSFPFNSASVSDDRDFTIGEGGIVLSIVPVPGRDDAFFSLPNERTLQFRDPDGAAPQDSNGDNIYLVTLRATDSGGLSSEVTYIFRVANAQVNFAPVLPPAETFLVPINNGFAVTLTASDDKPGTTYSFGAGTSAAFSIDATTGRVAFPAQPAPGIFTFVLRATDSDMNMVEETYMVQVTGTATGNRPPQLPQGRVFEATDGDGFFFNPSAVDPDGDPVTFSLVGGEDLSQFTYTLDDNRISIPPRSAASPIDADGNSTYVFTVRGEDPSGAFDEETYAFRFGSAALTPIRLTISENTLTILGGTAPYQLQVSDNLTDWADSGNTTAKVELTVSPSGFYRVVTPDP
ncbi:hypothetical protein OAF27_01085 [Verrucomicrobiales bacterium]|nr:hypothetical protein [Verrucomicrobiales bacterium]